MAEVRIVGDRVFESDDTRAEPVDVPNAVTPSPAKSWPRRLVIEASPIGQVTVHLADYLRRLPAYEQFARDIHGVPVGQVWEIAHSSALRGAITREDGASPRFVVVLNSLRTQCVIHRLATFEHELEHAKRGDIGTVEGYSQALEQPCEAAGDRAAELYARVAAERLRESQGHVAIDSVRCRECSRTSEAPCPQGLATYQSVNKALAGL